MWRRLKRREHIVTVHLEACEDGGATSWKIHDCGMKAGLSICPETPVSAVEPFLPQIEMLLIMSVHPGFGGQKFIPESLDKIREARQKIRKAATISTSRWTEGSILPMSGRCWMQEPILSWPVPRCSKGTREKTQRHLWRY